MLDLVAAWVRDASLIGIFLVRTGEFGQNHQASHAGQAEKFQEDQTDDPFKVHVLAWDNGIDSQDGAGNTNIEEVTDPVSRFELINQLEASG